MKPSNMSRLFMGAIMALGVASTSLADQENTSSQECQDIKRDLRNQTHSIATNPANYAVAGQTAGILRFLQLTAIATRKSGEMKEAGCAPKTENNSMTPHPE